MAAAVASSGQTGAQAGFVISGGAAKGNLLNTDAPEHTRLRKLVMQAFSPRQIAAQEKVIAALVESQLDSLAGREQIDLIADFAYPIAITTICRILGVPSEDQDKFRLWATAASTPHAMPDATITQAEGAQALQAYLGELIGKVRERIKDGHHSDDADVLSAMARAQSEGEGTLSDEELRSMAFLLLIAGHETTVGLISASLLRLCGEPAQRQVLIDNPDMMSTAIEEFLRMDGSVHSTTFRVATDDVIVDGYRIPKGGITIVSLPSANRDPSRFENPNRYDVTRKVQPNLAFGSGPHTCVGNALARVETRLAVGGFLRRFPQYQTGTPVWAKTIIRAPQSVPVALGAEVKS